jgi:DNA polymerase III subunit delta
MSQENNMIFFLYGEDSFRSSKKLNELKKKFLHDVDPDGTSMITLGGENLKLAQINEAVSPNALFSRKRMIVVENIFKNKDNSLFAKLESMLGGINDDKDSNIIVFYDEVSAKEKMNSDKNALFRFLVKQKYSQSFAQLSVQQTAAWIKEEVRKKNAVISHDALVHLSAITENDLWRMENEIEKLVNYKEALKADDKNLARIDIKDIEELVQNPIDTTIFSLTDALSGKNKPLAIKIIEEQLNAGVSDNYMLSMITRQFKIILQIRDSLDAGQSTRKITGSLKLHPYVVQKGIVQARNFSLASLKIILHRLLEIDYSMKKGVADIKTELSMFVASL